MRDTQLKLCVNFMDLQIHIDEGRQHINSNMKPNESAVFFYTLTWSEAIESILQQNRRTQFRWIAVSSDSPQLKENTFSWQISDSGMRLSLGDLKQFTFDGSSDSIVQEPTALRQVADYLHDAADYLPAYGCLLEIYLWLPKDTESSDFTLLLGALRRLKDWHNADITIFDRDLSPATEFLQRFLSASVYFEENTFQGHSSSDVLWRGKISVNDKIDNKGITVPGVHMTKLTRETADLVFPLRCQQQTHVKDEASCLLGRMLEVLDEVSLSSVPSIMKTSHSYKLSLYQKHPFAQVFMNYIQQSTDVGLLARLAVYPDSKKIIVCKDTNLSTNTWKENIMSDIQFVQEPEEDFQDNYEFLYFIITSPDKNSPVESFTAHAHFLHSPYELSGDIIDTIFEQMLVKNQNVELDVDLDKLPVISPESMRKVHNDMVDVHSSCLQRWLDEKKKKNLSTIVSVSELNAFLVVTREKFLEQLSTTLPRYDDGGKVTEDMDLSRIPAETVLNSIEWPERQIQQYNESQKRSLSRIRSTESMPMSSPLQPCEASKTVDIQDFLRFFNPDGTAAADNLSPIHRRHPSRAQSRISQTSVSESGRIGWPESKEVHQHDVYYNTDRKTEKVNNHLNKLRDKFVKNDTQSSCTSSQVVFPKPTKRRQSSTDNPELRRSPRKRAPRSMFDENIPGSQHSGSHSRSKVGRLSDSSTPLASLQQNESRRRFSTPHALPSQRQSLGSSQPAAVSHQSTTTRRRSEISHSQPGAPVPRQVEKLRRESDSGLSCSQSQSQKETRSERHKRKLQEIVDKVLNDNRVGREDPIFSSCSTRLFKVTKLFVMDLPTSRNLREEMKKIAESQVKQEYREGVKQFESRSGPTSGSKLFAKVISRRQKSLLAGKELIITTRIYSSNEQ